MRAFKIYSLSNFQICNTVLLIVTMLYITSPWHLFQIGSLYLFTLFTHFPHPLHTCFWQPPICSLGILFHFCFALLISFHVNEILQCLSSSVWHISLSLMPSAQLSVARFHSFLWLHNILLVFFNLFLPYFPGWNPKPRGPLAHSWCSVIVCGVTVGFWHWSVVGDPH